MLLVCILAIGYGQDFSVTFSSGKTLYFTITSSNTVKIAKGKHVISQDFWGKQYGYSFSGSLTIPATVTDNGVTYKVTEVDHLAKTNLTSVKIPNTVSKISSYAFAGCKELVSVTLPSSLEFIDNGAFSGCTKLSSINFPESLQKIGQSGYGDGAFARSGLKSVIIPGHVKDVGWNTFYGCQSLIYAEMKEGVSSFGTVTFEGCHRLRTIKLPKSLLPFLKRELTTADERILIRDFFQDCPSLEQIIVPDGTLEEFSIYLYKHKHLLVEE